jgi:purine/pyrimidine-nucleoside phosphorylase
MSIPDKFENVTVLTKANVYFDGKVISHTVLLPDGARKTLGLIYPGLFKFDTGAPERMDITAGSCRVRIDGQEEWMTCEAGKFFRVPGKSFFQIEVAQDRVEYICSFE